MQVMVADFLARASSEYMAFACSFGWSLSIHTHKIEILLSTTGEERPRPYFHLTGNLTAPWTDFSGLAERLLREKHFPRCCGG